MNKSLLIYAAAGLLLTACNKSSSDSVATPDTKYITVEAEIGNLTRATVNGNSTTFAKGDQISLYAWTGAATDMQSMVVNGVVNTLGEDLQTWTPDRLMLWADMVTKHYFLSFFPARTVTNFIEDEFAITEGDYEASDLLVASVSTGLTATDNPVNLRFDHEMAKLYVNMNFHNQWASTPDITSCSATAASSCTINHFTKEVTPKGAQTAINLMATTPANTFAASYQGIMVPQTFRTVSITIGEQTFTYTHSEDIPLEAGKFTTLNLLVGRDRIEIGTVSISDWTEGTEINGGEAM